MKVTAVGTSCSWFSRNNTSFLIDDDIVFDVPSGAYKNIITKIDLKNIKAVLISHFHSDHFGDFHLIATRFMREFNRNEKLKVYAPKGILERMININKYICAGADELNPEKFLEKIEFIELSDGFEFEIGKYKLTSFEMLHGMAETYGFVIEDKTTGVKVGFSADTEFCDNLTKIVSLSNYAFLDMSSPTKYKKHLCIEEVEGLIKEYPTCKIFPVHTCDQCQEYARKHMNLLKMDKNLNFKHIINLGEDYDRMA